MTILVCITVLWLFSCSVQGADIHRISKRLAGGDEAAPAQFPYMAYLTRFGFFICGGVIIGPQWILTAGHCLKNKNKSTLEIYVGGTVIYEQGDPYSVKEIFIHPNFSSSIQQLRHDLGLVQLTKSIQFSPSIQPVAKIGRVEDNGVEVVATGWGTVNDEGDHTDKLQYSIFRTLPIKECQIVHKQVKNLVDGATQICIDGGMGKAVCAGDSGGPLIRKDNGKLVGIFSGYQDCTGAYPPLYVRLCEYTGWIKNVTSLDFPVD